MTALVVRPLALAVAMGVAFMLTGCAHFVVLHDPLTPQEHNDLGVAYETSGNTELAAREYRKAVSLDPHASRAWVNLGNVEAARGRWPLAEKSYRRALREAPTDADAMNNLAFALLQQGRHQEEARTLAERAVATGGARDSVYRSTLNEVRRRDR